MNLLMKIVWALLRFLMQFVCVSVCARVSSFERIKIKQTTPLNYTRIDLLFSFLQHEQSAHIK